MPGFSCLVPALVQNTSLQEKIQFFCSESKLLSDIINWRTARKKENQTFCLTFAQKFEFKGISTSQNVLLSDFPPLFFSLPLPLFLLFLFLHVLTEFLQNYNKLACYALDRFEFQKCRQFYIYVFWPVFNICILHHSKKVVQKFCLFIQVNVKFFMSEKL